MSRQLDAKPGRPKGGNREAVAEVSAQVARKPSNCDAGGTIEDSQRDDCFWVMPGGIGLELELSPHVEFDFDFPPGFTTSASICPARCLGGDAFATFDRAQ